MCTFAITGRPPTPMLLLTTLQVMCDGGLYWIPVPSNCVTAKECVNNSMIAYKITMQCQRGLEPDEDSGFKPDENGVSSCPDGMYTVFDQKKIWCINDTKDCKDCYRFRGLMVLAVGSTQCLGLRGWRAYNWEGKNECINNCYRIGGFAYKEYCVTSVYC